MPPRLIPTDQSLISHEDTNTLIPIVAVDPDGDPFTFLMSLDDRTDLRGTMYFPKTALATRIMPNGEVDFSGLSDPLNELFYPVI